MNTNFPPDLHTEIAGNGTELIRYNWDELLSQAFDALIERAEGVTLAQVVDRLEVPEHVARQTINKLREMLAEDGDTSIIAVPNGRERRYQLVNEAGTAVEGWAVFNQKYIESRISTIEQVYRVLVRSAKSERERDDARRILKTVQRLREDVQDMQADRRPDTMF